jgi:hypothetical protein
MKEAPAKPKATRFALLVIVIHAAISALHGAAHQALNIQLSTPQLIFIVAIILIAPLMAGALLWKKAKTPGALLLIASMAGSFVFGVYNHFMMQSPDHVSHVAGLPQKSWAIVFQITAALLALVELVGIYAGIRVSKKGL